MHAKNFSKILVFLAIAIIVNLIIYNAMRLLFFMLFNSAEDPIPLDILYQSLYIGCKFDLRLALCIHLPLFCFFWVKGLDPFSHKWGKRIWGVYLTATNSLVVLVYLVDLGHYEYLHARIDATALRFLLNPQISLVMVWESYPVVWGIFLYGAVIASYSLCYHKLIVILQRREIPVFTSLWKFSAVAFAVFWLFFAGIYGKFGYFPLRWSDAFFSPHPFAANVALNPILNLLSTIPNSTEGYERKEVEDHYQIVSAYLGVEKLDREKLRYTRIVRPAGEFQFQKPNIIVVFLESLAYHMTGLSGNPHNPTPNFDAMAQKSLLFTRFYTPHRNTERSVFTVITGIPDTGAVESDTRNPRAVRQHTIINTFKGYRKFYFLGGSASWGNIRGVLSHNIPDLELYEEKDYTSPHNDTWGISDLHLFEEVIKVLHTTGDQPFFAMIQTAGNHQPYTIPNDNRGFQRVKAEMEKLHSYGLRTQQTFNSLRFLDHSLGVFLEQVKREKFFNNTIFFFFGDHGERAKNISHMAKAEAQLNLCSYHVPLAIYAPVLIPQGRVYDKVVSEVDLLPTMASMASLSCVNSTFGRNLFDPQLDKQRYAFTIYHSHETIGLVSDKFYFMMQTDGSQPRLHAIESTNPRKDLSAQLPGETAEYQKLCRGIYETARYIRFHNGTEIAKINR